MVYLAFDSILQVVSAVVQEGDVFDQVPSRDSSGKVDVFWEKGLGR
jgi:hypothetical protein